MQSQYQWANALLATDSLELELAYSQLSKNSPTQEIIMVFLISETNDHI